VPSLEALVAQAETSRGDLAAFRHEIEAARAAARAADRRRMPEPEVFVGTKSSTAGTGGGGAVTVGSGAVGPRVQATIPLFDRAAGRALPPRVPARPNRKPQPCARCAARRPHCGKRWCGRAVAERYRAEGLNSAAQIERIAQVSYDAGERGILELLDAYRLAAAARLRQTALDLAVREAEIELGFTTGWEMPS
jgi:cobalt-zinc-cadmium efflux system outer membrane protein